MSYQSDIYLAVIGDEYVSGLIGGRFFWDIADGSEAVPPYIVAQTISDSGETDYDGTRGLSFPLIQFSAWAKTKLAAVDIIDGLTLAIEGKTLLGDSGCSLSFSNRASTFDPSTRFFGEILDLRGAISLQPPTQN